MKIAIEGCAHGELERIYETIEGIEKERNIKIDLLLCCGDFQSTRNVEDLQTMAVPRKYLDMCSFYKFYSGERLAPILTIFIGGNHEASNYLQELPYGGWVAPNIFYLGYAGVVNVNGIRIGGISGIYKGHDFLRGHHEFPPYSEQSCRSVYHVRQLEVFRLQQLSGNLDIFMSHDWPRGIQEYGNKAQLLRFKPHFEEDIANGQLGSRPLEELLKMLQPSYWFAAHLHCKFAALVPHHRGKRVRVDKRDESSSSSSSESEDETEKEQQCSSSVKAVPVTKFLALDKCLPKRRFLQLLDLPVNVEGPPILEYDAEWLSILRTTNHLLCVKDSNYYLPGKKAGSLQERSNFTPSEEELEYIRQKFEDLQVPQNFCQTAHTFDAQEQSNYKHQHVSQPAAVLNPQSNDFCTKLGIDDPLCLAILASGNQLPKTANVQETTSVGRKVQEHLLVDQETTVTTPSKRKMNLSLPAPTARVEIALPAEEEEMQLVEQVKQEPPSELPAEISLNLDANSPLIKKLKRRNQSIYQTVDNED
ncbi:lariat debranching enzyme [Drosophila busckii]|uniref:lariat debranching enzyme n=1 Tax=Drosophila busckii TaxID=30019 RepID=UPI00083EA65F|nr:lariat debranching enzyme [Drosophila busckii]